MQRHRAFRFRRDLLASLDSRGERMKWRLVDLAVLATLAGTPAHAAEWTGAARVIDGDTLEIGGTRLRLAGIDAAEAAQICVGPGSVAYDCGYEATQELVRLIGDQTVRCSGSGTDRLHQPLVVCRARQTDLNAEMVRSGWAVAWQGRDYQRLEDEARAARRGLWQGKFQRPEAWRREKETGVPGTATKQ